MSCSAPERRALAIDRPAPALLLATDFDGTIAPIVNRPEDAAVAPVARSVLERCSRIAGVSLAVVTGRESATFRPYRRTPRSEACRVRRR